MNRPHPYYLPETPEEFSMYCSTLTAREEELFHLLVINFLFQFTDTILDCDYIDPYILTKRYVKLISEKLSFKLSEKDEAKAASKAFESMTEFRALNRNFCRVPIQEVD